MCDAKTKKIIIAVDCQHDFISPRGALYVNGSLGTAHKISEHIPEMDGVIFTVDWHPINHCSFILNGGEWPAHCLMYSEEAAIPNHLLLAAKGMPTLFLEKGTKPDVEEYGAFEEPANVLKLYKWLDASFNEGSKFELYVCGVAGDYCVNNTVKSLLEYECERNKHFESIKVIEDLCPCIDKRFDMKETCEKLGVECVNSKEIF